MVTNLKPVMKRSSGKLNITEKLFFNINSFRVENDMILQLDQNKSIMSSNKNLWISMEEFLCDMKTKIADVNPGFTKYDLVEKDSNVYKVLVRTPKETRQKYSMNMSVVSGMSLEQTKEEDAFYRPVRPNVQLQENSYYLLTKSLKNNEENGTLSLKLNNKDLNIDDLTMKGDLLQVKNNDEVSDYDGTSLLNLSSFVYNEDTTSINIQKKEKVGKVICMPTQRKDIKMCRNKIGKTNKPKGELNNINLPDLHDNEESVDLKNIWFNLKKIYDKDTKKFTLDLPNGVSVNLKGIEENNDKIKFYFTNNEDDFKEVRVEEAWMNLDHICINKDGEAMINFVFDKSSGIM